MVVMSQAISKSCFRHKPRPITCKHCEYKTSNPSLLKKHISSKSCGKNTSLHKCPRCDYSTIRKRHLVRHMFTHGGKKPHICEICDKRFSERTQLKYHVFRHMGKGSFQCGYCDAQYHRKQDLKVHIFSRHK